MRRRRRLPTRRRRALGCAALALALLLLVQGLLHTGLLLPIQAVRLGEGQEGVRDTRVILRQWEPELYRTSLCYLTASDRALVLSHPHLTVRGWQGGGTALLDCVEDQPLHAKEQVILLDAGAEAENRYYGTHHFFYGRVDDPAIETVEIQLKVPPEAAEGGPSGHLTLTAPIIEREGRRYFLLDHRLSFVSPVGLGREDCVVGRNGAGEAMATVRIEAAAVGSCQRAPRAGETGGT